MICTYIGPRDISVIWRHKDIMNQYIRVITLYVFYKCHTHHVRMFNFLLNFIIIYTRLICEAANKQMSTGGFTRWVYQRNRIGVCKYKLGQQNFMAILLKFTTKCRYEDQGMQMAAIGSSETPNGLSIEWIGNSVSVLWLKGKRKKSSLKIEPHTTLPHSAMTSSSIITNML